MQIKVKVYMEVHLDPDEYTMPSDGDVTEELSDSVREYIHEIDGLKVANLRVVQGREEHE